MLTRVRRGTARGLRSLANRIDVRAAVPASRLAAAMSPRRAASASRGRTSGS